MREAYYWLRYYSSWSCWEISTNFYFKFSFSSLTNYNSSLWSFSCCLGFSGDFWGIDLISMYVSECNLVSYSAERFRDFFSLSKIWSMIFSLKIDENNAVKTLIYLILSLSRSSVFFYRLSFLVICLVKSLIWSYKSSIEVDEAFVSSGSVSMFCV
jgi:hypothetical protein